MEPQVDLKHMMFLRRLSFDQIKHIIQTGKFNESIQLEKDKITLQGQVMSFRFCDDPEFNIIGMESNIINVKDYDRFYWMAEYIGKVQINLYNLRRI
jgi:hypothetical protein